MDTTLVKQILRKETVGTHLNNTLCMKYDICFLTTMYPEQTAKFYTSEGFLNDSEHITYIQKSLIEGLEEAPDITVHIINKLLGHRFSKSKVPQAKWRHSNQASSDDISFSYVKGKLYSSIILFHYIKPYLKEWIDVQKSDTIKIFLVYAITNSGLDAIRYVKRINSNIRTGIIVPDIPTNTRRNLNNPIVAIKNKIADLFINIKYRKSINNIDRFYLFSKYMADILRCGENFSVIEPPATNLFENIKPKRFSPPDKIVIVYGGGLHRKYGIKILIDAILAIGDPNYELFLYGFGDYVEEIKILTQNNKNIIYGGSIPREELLSIELGADILINPRPNLDEFLYSCPSKNLEYLSSGIPFIGFHLKCISSEYDPYINYPDSETVASLAQKIVEVGSIRRDEAVDRAIKAKNYIMVFKSKKKQADIIINTLLRS